MLAGVYKRQAVVYDMAGNTISVGDTVEAGTRRRKAVVRSVVPALCRMQRVDDGRWLSAKPTRVRKVA